MDFGGSAVNIEGHI